MHRIFIHSLVGIYFGCFLLFDTVNIAAVNIVLQTFAWTRFLFIWGMSQKGIIRSYGNSFYEMLPGCIPQWLLCHTFCPAVYEGLTRLLNR